MLAGLVLALPACEPAPDVPATVPVDAPAADPLRPLSPAQYAASLTQLLGPEVVAEAAEDLAAIPPLGGKGRLEAEVLDVSQAAADAMARAAERVAHAAAATPERLARLAPCLAAPTWDPACGAAFVQRFGRLTHRRPLTADETAHYQAGFETGRQGSVAEAVELTLYALLSSPRFLYRVEDGGPLAPGAADVAQLTSYEQVTRLAFMLLGSTPSEQLLDAAATAPRFDAAALEALTATLASSGVRAPLERFFAQWLGLDSVPDLPYPPGFVDPFLLDGLQDDMRAEVTDFLARQLLDRPGTLADLLTTPDAWLRSASLATLYGLTLADAGPGGRLQITDGTRAGLLTLPGMLRGLGEFPSPVPRGLRILDALLCRPVPIPDPATLPEAALALPDANGELTNRQRWEHKTSSGACAQCHADIHAVGFALEHYDTLGRYRDQENTLSVMWPTPRYAPVDSRTVLTLDGEPVPIADARALSAALAASPEVHRCVAQWWFREALGRRPEAADQAVIQALADRIARDPLIASLHALATTAALQLRRIPE